MKYIASWRKVPYKNMHAFTLMDIVKWRIKIDRLTKIGPWSTSRGMCEIGKYSYIWANVELAASDEYRIQIWKFCSIASGTAILSSNNHDYTKITTYPSAYWLVDIAPNKDIWWDVTIGHDVRIGLRSIILPWVAIWHGAVIWAWSVITKDVPPYAIVWGVPAKVIKYRFDEKTIENLIQSSWRDWDIEKIKQNYSMQSFNKSNSSYD